jgi:hypothetical protein
MKKTILIGAMLALSSFCWGTDIHSDNFKELWDQRKNLRDSHLTHKFSTA